MIWQTTLLTLRTPSTSSGNQKLAWEHLLIAGLRLLLFNRKRVLHIVNIVVRFWLPSGVPRDPLQSTALFQLGGRRARA
jgi:hypothetical protein